jgi:dihydrofolate synthase/folylpolyglutamate synthase
MTEFAKRADLDGALGAEGGPQFLHVAGTNGKGSVTAFIQSMLIEAGYRTGAFFSPYVVDPRERVWMGREMIPKQDFAVIIADLKKVAETLDETEFGGVTEFEMKTAVGFDFWRRNQAQFVALEVGLGGRFDATNIVKPISTAIVSIGLDHTQILGDTVEKIAFEKAGIIKRNAPLAIGEMADGPKSVIEEIARENGVEFWRMGDEIQLERTGLRVWKVRTPMSEVEIRPSLFGDVQGHNAALAYATVEISGAGSGQDLADGLSKAAIPGRFQLETYKGRTIVLDGAHNAESAMVLLQSLHALRRERMVGEIRLVSGMVSGHDPQSFFRPFFGKVREVFLAPIDFHRALAPSELREAIQGHFESVEAYNRLSEALKDAVAASGPTDVVLVTGSFYLVGEAIRLLRAN